MTTTYEKNAARALEKVDGSLNGECSSELIEAFFVCVALLYSPGKPITVATVLEFVDAREHVMMEPEEIAGAIRYLSERGMIEVNGSRVAIPEPTLARLPRKRGKIDAGRASRPRWHSLLQQGSER